MFNDDKQTDKKRTGPNSVTDDELVASDCCDVGGVTAALQWR